MLSAARRAGSFNPSSAARASAASRGMAPRPLGSSNSVIARPSIRQSGCFPSSASSPARSSAAAASPSVSARHSFSDSRQKASGAIRKRPAASRSIAGQGVVIGSVPVLHDLIVAGLLVNPFPEIVEPRIGYDLLIGPQASGRPEVQRFAAWIVAEAADQRWAESENETR
eukprot:gene6428-8533_t